MLVEVQLLQAIVQLGAIGILVYLVIWFTRIYIPDQRKERQAEREEMLSQRREQESARQAIQAAADARAKEQRKEYLDSLSLFRTAQQAENGECRKERQEAAALARQERELDRQSRHELGNLLQRAIMEMHEKKSPDGPGTVKDNR